MSTNNTSDLSWQELVELLASPDPKIRDGWALETLAEGVLTGRWKQAEAEILDAAIRMLSHPQIQGRAFAPLLLCWLMQTGVKDRKIFDACSHWYLTETDERGYDQTLGWLHSIAHGADALGYCAQYQIATGEEVLAIFARKISGSKTVWQGGENERIVAAITRTLHFQPQTDSDAFFHALPTNLLPQLDPREPNAPLQINLKTVLSTWYLCIVEGAKVDDQKVHIANSKNLKAKIIASLQVVAGWLI
ncbi:hypothetical protein BK816_01185 [Boudabousia tangfeifanii]|uniref:DUF2785 domain-containing protein n=1 Tax=Boudabousia tangfeifanii TaxID=1912795 RepID=A0A1D9MIQ3_9ACTO|nr:DUF2785 domain-containing protein [Boudabousia tangfeifanii]AOZ72078.1 hypothetical protein BK816_01185 [Boudabousia tangfeifanii]